MFKNQISLKLPKIIVICGFPGTGKTTLARTLIESLGKFNEYYDYHSTMEFRRDQNHKRFKNLKNNEIRGFYAFCKLSLSIGKGIILDSVFRERHTVYKYFYEYLIQKGMLIINCVCPEEVAIQRIKSRPKNDGLVSSPRNPKIYRKYQNQWTPVQKDFVLHSEKHGGKIKMSYLIFDTVALGMKEAYVLPAHSDIMKFFQTV